MNIYCHLFMVSWIFVLIRLRQRSAHKVHSLPVQQFLYLQARWSILQFSPDQSFFFFLVNLGTAMPLTQWEFELQAASLLSNQAKLAYIISHLTKIAEAWAPTKYCLRSINLYFTVTVPYLQQINPWARQAARAQESTWLCWEHKTIIGY